MACAQMEMNFIAEPELTFSDSGLALNYDTAVGLFEAFDESN
jgi:hypothetical protein